MAERKPTPPPRAFLVDALERGGEYEVRSGTQARRLRATLLGLGWIADGRITEAGRQAVTASGSGSSGGAGSDKPPNRCSGVSAEGGSAR